MCKKKKAFAFSKNILFFNTHIFLDPQFLTDGYVIIHKDFMSITFKIIYSLIAAFIYVLFKLV